MTLKLISTILSAVFRLQLTRNHTMNGVVQHIAVTGKPCWKVMATRCFFFYFAQDSVLKEKVILVHFENYVFSRFCCIKIANIPHFSLFIWVIKNKNIYMILSYFCRSRIWSYFAQSSARSDESHSTSIWRISLS